MINRDLVLNKINSIQNCLARIHQARRGVETLDTQDILALNLQRAAQLTIDIAFYIVSQKNLGLPSKTKDAFAILQKAGMISPAVAKNMESMVGFRNLSVHDYQALNWDVISSILDHHLSDFEKFYTEILQAIHHSE